MYLSFIKNSHSYWKQPMIYTVRKKMEKKKSWKRERNWGQFSLFFFSSFSSCVFWMCIWSKRPQLRVDSCCVCLWVCVTGCHVQPNDLSWGTGWCLCFMTCHKSAICTHTHTAGLLSGLYFWGGTVCLCIYLQWSEAYCFILVF